MYPPELAGKLYPNGIPIYPEEQLEELIEKYNVDIVVFAYSDVSHEHVMHQASRAHSRGADFRLLGPKSTMLKAKKPVIAIGAVRTGAGKSPTSRKLAKLLRDRGYKVAVVRHPMPYGDLTKQIAQKFETLEDMDRYNCTFEEREEYEPHIKAGNVVFAGVDYGKILEEIEKDDSIDIILRDGGNNDFPFYEPDYFIVVADPLRAGHELRYHPGETNARMADAVIVSKVNTAPLESIIEVEHNIEKINPKAKIIEAALVITLENPEDSKYIEGKRVVAIEDGPTVTHGEMGYGAAYIAAKKFGAAEIVDPRPYAVGEIKKTFEKYQHLKHVIPNMGYSERQIEDLKETLKNIPADTILVGTPIDLRRIIKEEEIGKKMVRVIYELQEIGKPDLNDIIDEFLSRVGLPKRK